jgi:hypothetical protein
LVLAGALSVGVSALQRPLTPTSNVKGLVADKLRDNFVVFPVSRALHTGDAFPNQGVPIMDANNGGSGVDYADTIAKAVDQAAEWKVPERFLKSGYTQPMPTALRSNVQVVWNEIK